MFEKIKRILSPADVDEAVKKQAEAQEAKIFRMPNRKERRERRVKRYRQFRRQVKGHNEFWEWKPTQKHPKKKRAENRRKNKAARRSRKAHR